MYGGDGAGFPECARRGVQFRGAAAEERQHQRRQFSIVGSQRHGHREKKRKTIIIELKKRIEKN